MHYMIEMLPIWQSCALSNNPGELLTAERKRALLAFKRLGVAREILSIKKDGLPLSKKTSCHVFRAHLEVDKLDKSQQNKLCMQTWRLASSWRIKFDQAKSITRQSLTCRKKHVIEIHLVFLSLYFTMLCPSFRGGHFFWTETAWDIVSKQFAAG